MSRHNVILAAIVLTGCGGLSPPINESTSEATMHEAEQYYRKGTELLDSDPEQAIVFLTKSLELEPDAPPALYNRAAAYASAGRDLEAVADIDRLEKVAPGIGRQLRKTMMLAAAPYVDIGNGEFEAGNIEAALDKYNSALAYDPACGDAWVCKGLALNRLGKAEEALTCYNRASEVDPDNYYAYINRAELQHEHRRLKEALADFTKAIALSPDESAPYLGRSAVYSELQMPTQAADDERMAKKLEAGKDIEQE